MGCQAVSTNASRHSILIEAKQLNILIQKNKEIKILCASLLSYLQAYQLFQSFAYKLKNKKRSISLGKNSWVKLQINYKLIPKSAQFLDLLDLADKEVPNHPIMMLRDTEKFQAIMKKYNLGFNDIIVLYDNYGMAGALKAWYILSAYGKYSNVYVLNGGFNRWKNNRFKIEQSEYKENIPRQGNIFDSYIYNSKFDISMRGVIQLIDNNYKTPDGKQVQFIDARSENLYKDGTTDENYIKGHIKQAINIPYNSILSDQFMIKNDMDLLTIFNDKQINLENKIIVYCNGGVLASCILFALLLLGAQDIAIFNGGYAEFGHVTNNNSQYCELG